MVGAASQTASGRCAQQNDSGSMARTRKSFYLEVGHHSVLVFIVVVHDGASVRARRGGKSSGETSDQPDMTTIVNINVRREYLIPMYYYARLAVMFATTENLRNNGKDDRGGGEKNENKKKPDDGVVLLRQQIFYACTLAERRTKIIIRHWHGAHTVLDDNSMSARTHTHRAYARTRRTLARAPAHARTHSRHGVGSREQRHAEQLFSGVAVRWRPPLAQSAHRTTAARETMMMTGAVGTRRSV